MASQAIPDGVYAGFTYSNFNGSPFIHNFITIVHDGVSKTFEYGPDENNRNAPQPSYNHHLETATYGYARVQPPPGVSESQFEGRIIDAAARYDALSPKDYVPYNAFNGANCENIASGLLKAAGVSQKEIEALSYEHPFGTIGPHFSKPVDLEAWIEAHRHLPTQHGAASQPPPSALLKTTDMNKEQLALYVDLRKEGREIFAEALGHSAPTVSVERNGITSDQERFSNSTGRIVGLEDGKLIQQSANGQRTALDYGDLLTNAKNPMALDAMARQALTTGEPISLSMQHGVVSMAHGIERSAINLSR